MYLEATTTVIYFRGNLILSTSLSTKVIDAQDSSSKRVFSCACLRVRVCVCMYVRASLCMYVCVPVSIFQCVSVSVCAEWCASCMCVLGACHLHKDTTIQTYGYNRAFWINIGLHTVSAWDQGHRQRHALTVLQGPGCCLGHGWRCCGLQQAERLR